MSKWRRRLHRRHRQSFAWLYRQHQIAMQDAPTIRVGSAGEVMEVLGAFLEKHGTTPIMRHIGSMATVAGRNNYFAQLGAKYGKMYREQREGRVLSDTDEPKIAPSTAPCRRCQECGYLMSLPFDLKVQEPCFYGSEHKFADFPNGETAADLARAEELIKKDVPLWRPLVGDDYKKFWCTPCTGDRNTPGMWAHWVRRDGLTICGEFHTRSGFPSTVAIVDVKLEYEHNHR